MTEQTQMLTTGIRAVFEDGAEDMEESIIAATSESWDRLHRPVGVKRNDKDVSAGFISEKTAETIRIHGYPDICISYPDGTSSHAFVLNGPPALTIDDLAAVVRLRFADIHIKPGENGKPLLRAVPLEEEE